MPCDFCKSLPLRTVRALNSDIEQGSLSLGELAARYGISALAVETHVNNCLTTTKSGYSLLSQLLDTINRAAVERKREHDSSGDEVAMDHYIALVREARSTVMAMDKLKPSEELIKLIAQQIISPLILLCGTVMSEESGRLRDEVRSYIEPDLYLKLDQSIKMLLRRTTLRLRSSTQELIPRLRRLLNVQEPEDQVDLLVADQDGGPEPGNPPVN
jgi:hypothetical protein